ncbi:MAG TPA: sulfatase-like hydrolase/transferase [Nocardioides sp.]|nr:sulfatase-like hydrolase/transferase [Nocardioides sp.]
MNATRLVTMALLLTLAGCGGPTIARERGTVEKPAPAGPRPALAISAPEPASGPRQKPNIVLVLMDDFSMDLLPTMRSAAAMRRAGAFYSNAFVADSFCCPSRASLMTGQYPHQTGVLTNVPGERSTPLGGFDAYEAFGNAERSFNVSLHDAGYTTGFVGKFLNHYEGGAGAPPVLPGWSEFEAVFGTAYDQWDFGTGTLGRDGRIHEARHPAPPAQASAEEKDEAYAGVRIERSALDFISRHRDEKAPYFLQVAPYGPHSRTTLLGGHYRGDPLFPAMFRDRPSRANPAGNCGLVPCRQLDTQDLPGFGAASVDTLPVTRDGRPAEAWYTGSPVSSRMASGLLRDRARMAQSIDRMVQRILAAVDDNTYVVLTSDNGFHLGQMGLSVGKGTPFDTDVHVPLLVVGPGVEPGTRDTMTSNIDLASTFEDLAGARSPAYRSGHSLVETFADPRAQVREIVFFEHTAYAAARLDPDSALLGGSEYHRTPSYVAVRDRDGLLVRYDIDPTLTGVDTAWGFYDYTHTGWERANEYDERVHADRIARLKRKLRQFDTCSAFVRDAVVPRECRNLTR